MNSRTSPLACNSPLRTQYPLSPVFKTFHQPHRQMLPHILSHDLPCAVVRAAIYHDDLPARRCYT